MGLWYAEFKYTTFNAQTYVFFFLSIIATKLIKTGLITVRGFKMAH